MLQIVHFLFAIKLFSDFFEIMLNILFFPFRCSTMETTTITPFVRKMTRNKTLLYCISRKTVDTEYMYYSWCMTSTDIVKWRKTNDYENFEKGMIYMKILNKGG